MLHQIIISILIITEITLLLYIYDKSSTLFGNREGEAILIIAKYQYEYTFVLEKEICIAAMLNKLLDICS